MRKPKQAKKVTIDTAKELINEGLDVYIITLNDPEGKIDYDLNDFFKKHSES